MLRQTVETMENILNILSADGGPLTAILVPDYDDPPLVPMVSNFSRKATRGNLFDAVLMNDEDILECAIMQAFSNVTPGSALAEQLATFGSYRIAIKPYSVEQLENYNLIEEDKTPMCMEVQFMIGQHHNFLDSSSLDDAISFSEKFPFENEGSYVQLQSDDGIFILDYPETTDQLVYYVLNVVLVPLVENT